MKIPKTVAGPIAYLIDGKWHSCRSADVAWRAVWSLRADAIVVRVSWPGLASQLTRPEKRPGSSGPSGDHTMPAFKLRMPQPLLDACKERAAALDLNPTEYIRGLISDDIASAT